MKKVFLDIKSLNPGEVAELHSLAERYRFDTMLSTLFQKEFEDFFENNIKYIVFSEDKKVSFLKNENDTEVSFEEAANFIKSVGKITA